MALKQRSTKKTPLGTLPRYWLGEIVALDLIVLLPRTRNGNVFILVSINHYSRWVELTALQKADVAEVVLALRHIWMPEHGVLATIVSGNGPQFMAYVVQYFCKGVGGRKTYSTFYHPQGNSTVESYMLILRKPLEALVGEKG